MKLSRASLTQAEMEAAIIANVSLKFEEAGIEVPIFSAYETKATKITDGVFWARKMMVRATDRRGFDFFSRTISNKTKLVSKLVAQTALRSEVMFPVEKNHKDICIVDVKSLLFQEFIGILESSVARGVPDTTLLVNSRKLAVRSSTQLLTTHSRACFTG
jgi:hypothetical protein